MTAALTMREFAPPAKPWAKACGVCPRRYSPIEWSSLPAMATLPVASVQAHLSVPAAWTVELRQCACGSMLATRSR